MFSAPGLGLTGLSQSHPLPSHGPAGPCLQPAVTGTPGTEGAQGGSVSFVTTRSNAMQNEWELQRELMEKSQEEKGEV